jgi:hypothetical protein
MAVSATIRTTIHNGQPGQAAQGRGHGIGQAAGADGGTQAQAAAHQYQHAPGQLPGGLPVQQVLAAPAAGGDQEQGQRAEDGDAGIGQ